MRCVLAALITLCAGPAYASDLMREVFGCRSNDRCVIRYNLGGEPHTFLLAASEVRILKIRIVIDGVCASACVIFASDVREHVCITRRARIIVHRGYKVRVHDRSGKELSAAASVALMYDLPPGFTTRESVYVPEYGADIDRWARETKALHPDPKVLTEMSRSRALRYWKACG